MTLLRIFIAIVIASAVSFHGLKKQSLDVSGAIAAFFVGFIAMATSYRFGFILILFYYTSSKLTKVREDIKARLEDQYLKGGQRNYLQVLANSFVATCLCVVYYCFCGEDKNITFEDGITIDTANILGFVIPQHKLEAHIWCAYIAHYACAAADTWASEIGILASHRPRLITSLFIKTVPPGTNGGVSIDGTLASAAGGAFIGFLFYAFALLITDSVDTMSKQAPMIACGLVSGVLGSLIDSFLGATLQASYYSRERKCIVKNRGGEDSMEDKSIILISGLDFLSNEAVNFISIFLTIVLMIPISPWIFVSCNVKQERH